MKDIILAFIERWSGRINNWAWDKRWKYRDHHAWIKGYKEWKKKKLKNPIWDGTSRILEIIKGVVLIAGLLVFVVLWSVVIFFMWIYDAIFGGWK